VGEPLAELPRSWLSVELPGYRAHPKRRRYSAFDPRELPPTEWVLDPEVRWLRSGPPVSGLLAAGCVASFSEFLYRFWIENEIWFALALEKWPLTSEQEGYANHYRRAR
jgi:hypothetical protein